MENEKPIPKHQMKSKDIEETLDSGFDFEQITSAFLSKKQKERMLESEKRVLRIDLRTKLILAILKDKHNISDEYLQNIIKPKEK